MITLKTLPQATSQQVFDQVVNHLLTQNARSTSEKFCLYRDKIHSLKCAAGCLIGDDEYNADLMEQSAWYSLVLKKVVPNAHLALISELQQVHDNSKPLTWAAQLKNIAVKFNLQFNPPS